MSSVCDWARLDLCQKPQGPVSLIKCMEDGCNRRLHHLCQTIWESDDEDVRQAHGTRKFCAHHHPALAKGQAPSNLLQEFSQSTIETMSTMTTATCIPLLPPMGNINIAGQSLHLNQEKDDNDDEELPPLEHIWDCPYIVKNSPTGWKCLWCSNVFVPVHATRALCHVIRGKGGGIKPCKASIPANYLARYQALRDCGSSKAESKKRGVEVVDNIVEMQQNSSVEMLLSGKRRCGSLSSNSTKSHLKNSHQLSSSAASINLFGSHLKTSHQLSSSAASKTFFGSSIHHSFLLVLITRQTFVK